MKILLIDDDKDDQILFCDAVNVISPEITCHFANNGREGIELLNSYRFLPELLFLDVNMPLMSGKETLKVIQSTPKLERLPVVMYSTSNNKREISRFKELKVKYLIKPNRFESLVRLLKNELTMAFGFPKEQLVI